MITDVQHDELNDEYLIKEFHNGKSDNFSILFQRHYIMIFNLSIRMLGNYEEAEDVTQDVFIKAYKHLNNFKGQSSFKTWIYKIGSTTCIDVIRKKKSLWNYLSKITEIKEHESEDKEWVQDVLNSLPERQRLLLIMKYIQDFSSKEIAEILNSTEGSIKVQICRARENFKEKSKKYL
ncbi:MAG: sigma-70 family RNA polymerase sigma factor [Candidatus Eremiobacterota bacterium]